VGELTPSVLALPYALVFVAVGFMGLVAVIVRGDPILRLAVLILSACALVWSAGFVIAASTRDPALAQLAYHIGYGPIPLVGPGLLMLILSVSGRFDSYRHVLVLAWICALTSVAVCWSTDWVVAGVRETPSGLLYSKPGFFHTLHVSQILVWGVTGMVISRRGMRAVRDAEWRAQRRRAIAVIILCILTLFDALLAHGVVGYYPIAWLPALFAAGTALWSIFRADLLRARGVDRPALFELAAMAGAVALLYAVSWGGNRTWMVRPLVTAIFLAPLPMLGLVAAWTLRIRRRRAERTSDAASSAVDAYADEIRDLDDENAVAGRFVELIGIHAPIGGMRVWLCEESGLRALIPAGAVAPRIDARVRAWLIANAEPLLRAELPSARLGGLRVLVEELVEKLGSDVVIPLVDRDALVGLATGGLPAYRVLRDDEREFVRSMATTAARGLTFLALTREAGHLASTAREVELADAVTQARVTGDETLVVGPYQVLGHYRPAARVAGDLWSCADLKEGRVLVFVADVAGLGVASALVSAAVGGVCETMPALSSGAVEPKAMLELAHRTVRDLGGGSQRVTAFAAVLDRPSRVIRWGCAGHRGGYLVHPPVGDEERARLDALGGRSTPLGEPGLVIAEGERPLADADHLVICSDGVVEVRDGRGDVWGDRRLQRMLRDQLLGAGDRAARMLVAAAVAHAGEAPILDDLLVVVVRPGAT
jgi:hypothetical protein